MIVDDNFLNNKFEDLKFAAKLEDFQPFGVVITDYFADSIKTFQPGAFKYLDKPHLQTHLFLWQTALQAQPLRCTPHASEQNQEK